MFFSRHALTKAWACVEQPPAPVPLFIILMNCEFLFGNHRRAAAAASLKRMAQVEADLDDDNDLEHDAELKEEESGGDAGEGGRVANSSNSSAPPPSAAASKKDPPPPVHVFVDVDDWDGDTARSPGAAEVDSDISVVSPPASGETGEDPNTVSHGQSKGTRKGAGKSPIKKKSNRRNQANGQSKKKNRPRSEDGDDEWQHD